MEFLSQEVGSCRLVGDFCHSEFRDRSGCPTYLSLNGAARQSVKINITLMQCHCNEVERQEGNMPTTVKQFSLHTVN